MIRYLPLCCAALLLAPAAHADYQAAAQTVRVEGRMLRDTQGWRASWPGASWQLNFYGEMLGVKLDDAISYYTLYIDGKPALTIAPQAGPRTLWVRELGKGSHSARLVKRSESVDKAGRFFGFVLHDQGWPQAPDKQLRRQIEFIGDSWTAGYGNLSPQRACDWQQVVAQSDVTQTFAALSARDFQAEAQINAMSGMGMVRNWDGNLPDQSYRSYYPRVLQAEADGTPGNDALRNPRWQPQLVVIGLGINDFSSPVKPGEARTVEELQRDYLTAYRQLLASLKQRYRQPAFVLSAAFLWPDDRLRPLVSQLVDEERRQGTSIAYVDWQGLELTGCNWHPNLADHDRMRQQLNSAVRTLGNIWDR